MAIVPTVPMGQLGNGGREEGGGPKKQERKDAMRGEQQSKVYDLGPGVIQPIYRVILVVSELDWVDLDLRCSAILLGQ